MNRALFNAGYKITAFVIIDGISLSSMELHMRSVVVSVSLWLCISSTLGADDTVQVNREGAGPQEVQHCIVLGDKLGSSELVIENLHPGEERKLIIALVNRSGAELAVASVQPDCRCISGEIQDGIIRDGDETVMRLSLLPSSNCTLGEQTLHPD